MPIFGQKIDTRYEWSLCVNGYEAGDDLHVFVVHVQTWVGAAAAPVQLRICLDNLG